MSASIAGKDFASTVHECCAQKIVPALGVFSQELVEHALHLAPMQVDFQAKIQNLLARVVEKVHVLGVFSAFIDACFQVVHPCHVTKPYACDCAEAPSSGDFSARVLGVAKLIIAVPVKSWAFRHGRVGPQQRNNQSKAFHTRNRTALTRLVNATEVPS